MNNVPTWSLRLLRGAFAKSPNNVNPPRCLLRPLRQYIRLFITVAAASLCVRWGQGGHSLMWGRGGVISIKHMLIKKLHEKVKILRIVRGGWGVKDKNIRIFFGGGLRMRCRRGSTSSLLPCCRFHEQQNKYR